MKYVILLPLLFTGCATLSQYDLGCRDGLNGILPVNPQNAQIVGAYCDSLDNSNNDSSKDYTQRTYPRGK